jgi:hypothetical protein
VIVFTGEAFLKNYHEGLAALEMTPEGFGREYSVAIRIRPTEAQGWE